MSYFEGNNPFVAKENKEEGQCAQRKGWLLQLRFKLCK